MAKRAPPRINVRPRQPLRDIDMSAGKETDNATEDGDGSPTALGGSRLLNRVPTLLRLRR